MSVVGAVRTLRFKMRAKHRLTHNPSGTMSVHRANKKKLANIYRKKRATAEGRAELRSQIKKYI
jgi:hypothetical protein